jgi:hypothetical protein
VAQWPPRPKMALEAPRPLLGAGYYMKKLVAYLNNIQRKKLFYIQTLTKLPELTEPECIMVSVPLRQKVAVPAVPFP